MGQNFLVDKNVVEKLIRSYELDKDDRVVEIGPGFGAMTLRLAEECGSLWAVEKDRKAFKELCSVTEGFPNVKTLNEDFLLTDLKAFREGNSKLKVIGNIPYSISSPIIERIIEERALVSEAFFVMQEELVDRITASPGGRDYSRLSVFVQFYSRASKLFRITKGCFYPVPKVDSALLRLVIDKHPRYPVKDEELLWFLVKAAFSQRRKKAVNAIAGSRYKGMELDKSILRKAFTECGLDASTRAEQLDIAHWASFSDLVAARLPSLG